MRIQARNSLADSRFESARSALHQRLAYPQKTSYSPVRISICSFGKPLEGSCRPSQVGGLGSHGFQQHSGHSLVKQMFARLFATPTHVQPNVKMPRVFSSTIGGACDANVCKTIYLQPMSNPTRQSKCRARLPAYLIALSCMRYESLIAFLQDPNFKTPRRAASTIQDTVLWYKAYTRPFIKLKIRRGHRPRT